MFNFSKLFLEKSGFFEPENVEIFEKWIQFLILGFVFKF